MSKKTCRKTGLLFYIYTMKKIFIVTILVSVFACKEKDSYAPETHLEPLEKVAVMEKIIYYVGRKPEKANHTEKFNPEHAEHYTEQFAKHSFTHYYIADNGEHFFVVRRIAPSLYEKYVAIGGRMQFDKKDSIVRYEEVFRTWKMQADTLQRRSTLLFDKMVKGESLEPYRTKNSGNVEYIEFPDDFVYYDVDARVWRSKQFGSVEEMVLTDQN